MIGTHYGACWLLSRVQNAESLGTMSKRYKELDGVYAAEEEFGSIDKVPKDDARILAVQKVWRQGHDLRMFNKSNRHSDTSYDDIITSMWTANYQDPIISKHIGHSTVFVRNRRQKLGLIPSNTKRYMLVGKDIQRFNSLPEVAVAVGLSKNTSSHQLIELKAKQLGYIFKRVITHKW